MDSVKVSLIVAADSRGVIGSSSGKSLWRLHSDLKRFRELTSNHSIIMGRITYETISRPLPNRHSIVLTRQAGYVAPGCSVVHSIKEAYAASNTEEVFVIGGGTVYEQTMQDADTLYITEVESTAEGDIFFNPNLRRWTEVERIFKEKDSNNSHNHSYVIYKLNN